MIEFEEQVDSNGSDNSRSGWIPHLVAVRGIPKRLNCVAVRLWSLHPSHLDRAGLIAAWRETLLAQAVLAERTKGYRQHPQLIRFRDTADPIAAIGTYLSGLVEEAQVRGYKFQADKIIKPGTFASSIPVTQGQLDYEWQHLGNKLAVRSPADAKRWHTTTATSHPIFTVVPGEIESWERP